MEKDLKYTKWLIEKMYDEGLLTVDFNQASCPVQDTFEKWMRHYGNEFLEELRASQKPSTSDEALHIADVGGNEVALPDDDVIGTMYYDEDKDELTLVPKKKQ